MASFNSAIKRIFGVGGNKPAVNEFTSQKVVANSPVPGSANTGPYNSMPTNDYALPLQPRTNMDRNVSFFSNAPLSLARRFKYGTINDLDLHTRDLPDPILRPINRFAVWHAPPVSFADMQNAYELDPEISFGIDFLVSVTVGAGHYVTSPYNRVVDHLMDFSEEMNLDLVATTAAKETLAYGNSVWRYVDFFHHDNRYDMLEQMPLTALKRIWWNGWLDDSSIGFYEFRGYKVARYMPSQLVHFRWRLSNASPYGYGLVAPLVQKVDYRLNRNGIDNTYTRMALIDIKRSIQDTIHKGFKRYINRNVYIAPNASPQQISGLQNTIDTLYDEQDFVVPDGEFDVKELGSAARSIDLETWTSVYTNEFIKSLGTPVSRLFEKGSLTEASAQSAKEAAMINMVAFARQMKRQVERFVLKTWYDANPVTDVNGIIIPWKEAQAQLEWGTPEKSEISMTDFAMLINAKPEAFSIQDIRRFCADMGIQIDPEANPLLDQQKLLNDNMNKTLMQGANPMVQQQFQQFQQQQLMQQQGQPPTGGGGGGPPKSPGQIHNGANALNKRKDNQIGF